MTHASRRATLVAAIVTGVAACGGGSTTDVEAPVNIDYSALRLAESRDAELVPATRDEQVLQPLKNGVRMSISGGLIFTAGLTAPPADGSTTYSSTTVQVDGVDESDLVKYDGRYIYSVRPEPVAAGLTAPGPRMSRNVLQIVRTNATTAGTEVISEFDIQGEQSTLPQLYQLASAEDDATASTQFLATVSQNAQVWTMQQWLASPLVVQPDRTTVQLLDVQDPHAVSQAWKLEMDGWLKATRKIGDQLYLVTSFRPRISGLQLNAATTSERESNERRIRSAAMSDLLPRYRENDGVARQLLQPGDCLVATDMPAIAAYGDLTVITSVSLTERRITDTTCLSTNVNGVYVSTASVYIAGEGYDGAGKPGFTVLHKFGLDGGHVDYRASGAVAGRIGWTNPAYFMDERLDTLRVLTTQQRSDGSEIHQLNVLQETSQRRLQSMSLLPSAEHPAPLGKPGERVHAVRFFGDRAYVVTARVSDPLYVIDLTDPFKPFIAGELEIPGFSTYLRPVGPAGAELLLSIGQHTNSAGVPQGVKVELFDVRDIARPLTIGAAIFGGAGSTSAALTDAHALTLLPVASDAGKYRLGLPIDVFATPLPGNPERFQWTYSGLHLLEVTGIGGATPQLDFHGIIKTQEAGIAPYLTYFTPNRSVMHDDGVFVVYGGSVASSLWSNVGE